MRTRDCIFLSMALTAVLIGAGCGAPGNNVAVSNTNVNSNTNVLSNTNLSNTTTNTSAITTAEPEQYQANVRLSLQTVGEAQTTATMPTLGAVVGRSGADRVMEFVLPVSGEKVIYLDKGGVNYLILPNRKQYAELTKDAVGFEVRRLMMPEQIIQQVKAIPGVKLAGEETLNGRPVVKYVYSGAANTGTQAGTVAAESYILVDKETSLPVRSETVAQSQTGGNVQGIKGLRILTEMTDIKTAPDASMFTLPADFQKIDPERVKAQATAVFQVVGQLLAQLIQQSSQRQPASSPAASVTATPSPR
jgi:hypothetical protein